MADIEEWPFQVVGDVKVAYTWNPIITEFEFGNRQYNRTQIHAKKAYEFKTAGDKDFVAEVLDFYSRHKGRSKPFYVTYYDGVRELCYFADVMHITYHRELRDIVGGELKVAIEVDKQVTKYPTPSIQDVLPLSRGNFEYTQDWNTTIYSTSSTQRRLKNEIPFQSAKVHFEGERDVRDKLISLFNSHEMMPLKLPADNTFYWVRFPSSIEITDHIAFEPNEQGVNVKQIVGFSSDIEFDIHVDEFYDDNNNPY